MMGLLGEVTANGMTNALINSKIQKALLPGLGELHCLHWSIKS